MTIKRCYPVLVGASVAENQLVQSGATSVIVQSGHKYYAKINGTESLGASTGSAITINDSAKDIVTDLTQKLGSSIADYIYSLESATAGSGIAKLREWGFLRGYQAFNAGSIESVEVTGKVVRGFNQWNEEWESGYYDIADGSEKTSSSWARNKELISVVPNTEYTFKANTSESVGGIGYILFYDGSKQYINSYVQMQSALYGTTGQQFTVPSNTCYIGFYMNVAWQSVGICINLSNPDRNGEYEAYTSKTYALGSDKLRGIFKLDANNNLYADGNRKTSDGLITRKYGIVDLGTLNYVEYTHPSLGQYFYAEIWSLGVKYEGAFSLTVYSAITTMYPVTTRNGTNFVDKTFCFDGSTGSVTQIQIKDSAYSDATAFKAAMSGVMLVYELATPTTEQSTPFQSPQVCYPDGTEEFITSNGVPVGHETRYEL